MERKRKKKETYYYKLTEVRLLMKKMSKALTLRGSKWTKVCQKLYLCILKKMGDEIEVEDLKSLFIYIYKL